MSTPQSRFEAAQRALNISNGLGQPWRGKTLGLYNKHKAALNPAKRYEPDFHTSVGGIPAGVVIIASQKPYAPSQFDPGCEGWVDIILVDRKGYQSNWLEQRADMAAIEQEALCYI